MRVSTPEERLSMPRESTFTLSSLKTFFSSPISAITLSGGKYPFYPTPTGVGTGWVRFSTSPPRSSRSPLLPPPSQALFCRRPSRPPRDNVKHYCCCSSHAVTASTFTGVTNLNVPFIDAGGGPLLLLNVVRRAYSCFDVTAFDQPVLSPLGRAFALPLVCRFCF
jgi:hypothetical protein